MHTLGLTRQETVDLCYKEASIIQDELNVIQAIRELKNENTREKALRHAELKHFFASLEEEERALIEELNKKAQKDWTKNDKQGS